MAFANTGSILAYPWPGTFPAPPGMDRFSEPQSYRLHAPGVGPIRNMVALSKHGIVFTTRWALNEPGVDSISNMVALVHDQVGIKPGRIWHRVHDQVGIKE